MVVLNLREEISESKNLEEISKIQAYLEDEIKKLLAETKINFAKNDLNQVAQNLIRVKYFDKTIADLKIKKQNF